MSNKGTKVLIGLKRPGKNIYKKKLQNIMNKNKKKIPCFRDQSLTLSAQNLVKIILGLGKTQLSKNYQITLK